MECLLSFIEFSQYQQYLINENYDRFHDGKNKIILNKMYLIALPSNIPLSALIEDKPEDKENPQILRRLSQNQRDRIYSLNSIGATSGTSPNSHRSITHNHSTPIDDHDHDRNSVPSQLETANNHSLPCRTPRDDIEEEDQAISNEHETSQVMEMGVFKQMETIPIPMDTYRDESPSAASRSTQPTDNEVDIDGDADDDDEDDINDEKDDLFKYKLKAHQIFEKYVKIGSEFEINISSDTRAAVTDILGDAYQLLYADNYSDHKLGLKDLLLIFEDCKLAMLELMQFSLTRFRNTAEFDKVDEIFSTNHYI